MEAAGAEVLVLAADVTDPADLRRVRAEVEAGFGGLDGIVHAAGVPGGGMAEVKERADGGGGARAEARRHLALAEAFGDLPLDLVVLCSSVTAVIGGFGQVDYCAANAFLDAYARVRRTAGRARVRVAELGRLAGGRHGGGDRRPGRVPGAGRGRRHRHPWTTRCSRRAAARTVTVLGTGWSPPAPHWVLDEHRIGGVPVLPGTAHLEWVRAAVVAGLTSPAPQAAWSCATWCSWSRSRCPRAPSPSSGWS